MQDISGLNLPSGAFKKYATKNVRSEIGRYLESAAAMLKEKLFAG